MVTRKTSSQTPTAKKSAAEEKSQPEDVIIEGVAEEVDPSKVKPSIKAKFAWGARDPRRKSTLKDTATPTPPAALMISLIALLLGGSGLALGGIAYLSVIKNTTNTDQLDIITKMIEDRIQITLAPELLAISNDIEQLTIQINDIRTAQDDAVDPATLAAIEDKLGALQQNLTAFSPNTHTHDTQASAQGGNRQHDDLITQALLTEALAKLRAELRAEIAAVPPTPTAAEPKQEARNQDDNDKGWLGNLMGAFSITRITSEETE